MPRRRSNSGHRATRPAPLDSATEREAWRQSFHWFVAACDERLGAWMRAHDLVGPEVETALPAGPAPPWDPPSCTVTWHAEGRELSFSVDYFYHVAATAKPARAQRSYRLCWFMHELDPGDVPSMPATLASPELALACLDRHARFLIQHGKAVLAPDPALLGRIAERVRVAVAQPFASG